MTLITKNHACRLKVRLDYLARAFERLLDPVANVGNGHVVEIASTALNDNSQPLRVFHCQSSDDS